MSEDYDRGFSDGFAAAVRQGLPASTKTIAEGFKNGPEKNRKIAIALPDDLFESIRDRAKRNDRSFAAEARAILQGRIWNGKEEGTKEQAAAGKSIDRATV